MPCLDSTLERGEVALISQHYHCLERLIEVCTHRACLRREQNGRQGAEWKESGVGLGKPTKSPRKRGGGEWRGE
eukprot:scaffold24891_cov32-Tisochrysis_lutea.AAC.1